MPFDKQTYDKDYNQKNVFVKRLPFNRNNPADVELLAFLEAHGNATQYLKKLIRRDLEAQPDGDTD